LGPFTVWKLKDKYGVLKTYTQETVEILGLPGVDEASGTTVLVRDTGTMLPVSTWATGVTARVGYIQPNVKDSTYSSYSDDNYRYLKASRNYRIYPKPWVTLSARIVEMVGDFDCNAANGEERVNAISAYVSSEDGVAGTYGASPKDDIRKAYPRNSAYPDTANYTVRWPNMDDYFTTAVWDRGNYSSKAVQAPANNCGWVSVPVKIVEKGKDSDNDNVFADTSFLTTGSAYFTGYEIPEFGYHTAGISATSTCVAPHCESAYFTDGYWQAYKGGFAGMLQGIQEQ
jgi:hypothetical protein